MKIYIKNFVIFKRCSLLRHIKLRSLHKFLSPTFIVIHDILFYLCLKHYRVLIDFMFLLRT